MSVDLGTGLVSKYINIVGLFSITECVLYMYKPSGIEKMRENDDIENVWRERNMKKLMRMHAG